MDLVLSVLAMSAFAILVALALVYSGSLISYLLFRSKRVKTGSMSVTMRPSKLNSEHSYQETPISDDGKPYQEMIEDAADRISARSSQSRIGVMKYLAEWVITRRAGNHSRLALDVMTEVSNRSYSLEHKEESKDKHE